MLPIHRSSPIAALILLCGAAVTQLHAEAVTTEQGRDKAGDSAIRTCLNPNEGCCCPDDPDKQKVVDCPKKTANTTTCNRSLINNVGFAHRHWAFDYRIESAPSGCASCGGSSGGDARLPMFALRRYHRMRSAWILSSFGPGVFSEYDTKVWLDRDLSDPNGAGNGGLHDVVTTRPLGFKETNSDYGDTAKDGVLWQSSHRYTGALRLFDDAGLPVADHRQAVTATLRSHSGTVFTFEIIRTDPDPDAGRRWGRLVSMADRNGNATTISYAYGRTATDGELGYDRSRLWQINQVTDAYGHVATFHYHSVQYSGQWCVSQVDLPNGEVVTYTYGSTTGKLEQVDHADGSTSTFVYDVDNLSQCTTVTYRDAAAEGTHRNKTAYYSLATWVDPDDPQNVLSQPEGAVRMITNADDEVTYLGWQDDADPELIYVYEGGNKLKRHKSNAYYPCQDDIATAWDIEQDESTYSWECTAKYNYNTQRMITREEDILGRYTYFSRDVLTGNITRYTHPDGTTEELAYNEYWQPTYRKDRLGRVTTWTYDAAGNMLSKTVGQALDGSQNVIPTADTATYRWEYNALGQVTAAKDPLYDQSKPDLHITEYEYSSTGDPTNLDGYGYLVKKIEAADTEGGPRGVTTWTYDAAGRLERSEDQRGRPVEYAYDTRNRCTDIHYLGDDSHELFTFHESGINANLLASRTDRNGNRTDFLYDASGRRDTVTTAASDPAIAVDTTYAYLSGTGMPDAVTRAGSATTYTYDYRNRRTASARTPDTATTLTDSTVYDEARRVAYRQDAYGRKTFFYYDVDTDYRVRTVRELEPDAVETHFGGLPTQAQLAGLARDASANPGYVIEDVVYDAERQRVKSVDGRGTVMTMAYDQRGRGTVHIRAAATVPASATVADIQAGTSETPITDEELQGKSEQVYDAASNVIEQRGPRYFDPADATGYQLAATTMDPNGRNLTATTTRAPGSPAASDASYTYHVDGRSDTTNDGRGNDWQRLWHQCCGRPLADVDPTGAGTIYNNDQYGNRIYQAQVADVAGQTNPHAPTGTLAETSTRYDARHRPVARTVWLETPHDFLAALSNPHDSNGGLNVPIADRTSVPVANATHPAGSGLTTTWAYDDDLTDGVGIDAITGLQPIIALANLGAGCTGSAVAITNPEGEVGYRISDGLGRGVITIDADGDVVLTDFDLISAGLVVTRSIVDPDWTGHTGLALTSEMHRDGAGNVRSAIDAENQATASTYDANGNRLSVRDPNAVGTDCTYDRLNRRTLCVDTALDTVQDVDYDAAGNIVRDRDGLGVPATYTYDAKGRRISTVDRNGGITAFYYDDNDNQVAIVDADELERLGHTGVVGEQFVPPALDPTWHATRYAYDPRNLLDAESFPGHDPLSVPGDPGYDRKDYAYDAARRLVMREDQAGDQTVYHYDLAGRLALREYPDGLNDDFLYDLASRLQDAVCPRYDATVHRTYTPAGKVEDEVLTVAGRTYTTSYTYDPAGRRETTTYPSARVCEIGYTVRSQLDQVKLAGDVIASFVYDAGGRETDRTLGNGLTATRTWRADNLADTIVCPGVVDLAYAYDANKRKTDEDDAILTGYAQDFGYDAADRLTDWSRVGTDLDAPQSQQWDLSLVGDMDLITTDAVTEDRQHNPVHEIDAIDSAVTNVEHDAKGNLTYDPKRGSGYYWDYENRLAHVANPAHPSILVHWPLNEDAGATAGDAATATVRDGAISGATWAATGRAGACLAFDGTDDAVVQSEAPTYLNGLSAISVAVWVKADATNVDRGILDTEAADGQDDELNLRYDKSGWGGGGSNLIKCSIKTTAGQTAIESANDVQATAWQHLVMVWRSGEPLALYIDGVATTPTYDEGALGGTITGVDQFLLGRACKGQTWDGLLDDVQVFGYALTPAEVAAMATRPEAPITSSYAYDALGRRVGKTAGGETTDYALAGAQVIEEYTAAGSQLEKSYVYGSYIDEPLMLRTGADQDYYYHRNHLYSTTAITDDSGVVVERYTYDAYGKRYVRDDVGVLKTDQSGMHAYGFTGRRLDSESGLMYFRARYFDDQLGRFVN
ncbi:hypothetical protein GF314_13460, partial [bacterium]|nr:hypothetical protein [bacterium]